MMPLAPIVIPVSVVAVSVPVFAGGGARGIDVQRVGAIALDRSMVPGRYRTLP